MKKRWNILPVDDYKTSALQEALHIHTALCNLLVQRGIFNFEAAKSFFRPQLTMLHSPWLMKDMQKAVNRIATAFNQKEKILVFGDYDVDGTTSVAMMYQFLTKIYDEQLLDFYIPHRYKEGYGISKKGIDHANENNFGLVICLDCGIKSVELIAYAQTLGIDFIVCDHHLPGSQLPPAAAILNPKQLDCGYPYKELCGCGVGFKLITALTETFLVDSEIHFSYLDLVATAIAADIVPMTGENRTIAFFGLKQLNTNPSPGIKALLQLAGIQKVISITNVVFIIAPRINAAGRMDDARKAVQLFIEKDASRAMEFAEMLHADNSERKTTDTTITEEALAIILADSNQHGYKSSVVFKEHWHKGVVGIVASRLIEHYYRPTVVLTRSGDIVAGSARSVPGFNLYNAIYECREYLLAYGGHFAAAGLSMIPENVIPFTKKFNEVVSSTISDDLLTPVHEIHSEINFADVKESLLSIVEQMEPFGPENMRPVFITRKVKDTGYSRILKEQHIRFALNQNGTIRSGIGFNMAEQYSLLISGNYLDIIYSIDSNEWMGTKSLQLKIIDVRIHEPG